MSPRLISFFRYFDVLFHRLARKNIGNFFLITPLHPNIAFHIETSDLLCSTNQMTRFYIKRDAEPK